MANSSNGSSAIVAKLWNYCNILRDDGLSYGDYLEQLTFLLFLKMADEQSRPPFDKKSPIPEKYSWPELLKHSDELEIHYRHTARRTRKRTGIDRRHLSQGAKQNPGPGEAAPVDRGSDRQGGMVVARQRRKRGRLRRAAAKERRGRQRRRRSILHSTSTNPRNH